jgi:chemotaxis protein methyltransferase CheR
VNDHEVDRLARIAAERTGMRLEAVDQHALGRLVAALDREAAGAEFVARAVRAEPDALDRLLRVALVGETYFFRDPEQLETLALEVVRRAARKEKRRITAWSAGCSSGEEAYSLAAALLSRLPADVELRVIGTDVVPSRIEQARRGRYGRWSIRGNVPYPDCVARDGDHVEVTTRLRDVTTFAVHDLRHAAPPMLGAVDVVTCRNVLVYFAPDAARRVEATLGDALASDGLIAFGAMDVVGPPRGLDPVARTTPAIYERRAARPMYAPSRAEVSTATHAEPQPDPRYAESSIEAHVRALRRLESGARDEAKRLLDELLAREPHYLPALLERALLDAHGGNEARATARMRELLTVLDALPPDAQIEGPEPLSAGYYRAAASAFLERSTTKRSR